MDAGTITGRALLRLTTAVANLGDGPLELRGGNSRPDGTQEVYQRVYDNGGGSTERLAGSFTFHPEHGHIHFDDFTSYNVREMTAGGGVGPVLRSGQKISFCLFDQTIEAPSMPRAATLPAYADCSSGSVQGISVGWSDIYQKALPDQWVDVTGLAAGRYWLEVVADPDNRIQESDESNNSVRIPVDIDPEGSILQPDRFEPNDSFETATPLDTSAGRGENFLSVHTAADLDFFQFTSPFTGTVVVDTWPDTPGLGDVNLQILGPDHAVLAESGGPTAQERVAAQVVTGQVYYLRVSSGGGATNPSYTLNIYPPPPTLSVAVADGTAAESGDDTAAFTISRSNQANTPLTVSYVVSGTAKNGEDYADLPGTVIIPPFVSSVAVPIHPLDDGAREGDETVVLSLAADNFYAIEPASAAAAVIIVDDEPPQPLPGPWTCGDVGPVGVPGAAEVFSDGTFGVSGSGAAPAGKADAFQFAHVSLAGDGAVIADLVTWDRQPAGANAGVAIMPAGSPRGVFLFAAPDGTISLEVRKAPSRRAKVNAIATASGATWLRLARTGRVVIPAISSDGATWQGFPAQKLKLPSVAYAGVAVKSADGTAVASARFAAVAAAGVPAAPHDLRASISEGRVDLSWLDDTADATGFVVERSTKKTKGYETLASLGADARGFTHPSIDLLPKRRYYYRVRAINAAGFSQLNQPVVVKL
jgi:hypothetical protein